MADPIPAEHRSAAILWMTVMDSFDRKSGDWAAVSMTAAIVLELIAARPELLESLRDFRRWGGTQKTDRAAALAILRLVDELESPPVEAFGG